MSLARVRQRKQMIKNKPRSRKFSRSVTRPQSGTRLKTLPVPDPASIGRKRRRRRLPRPHDAALDTAHATDAAPTATTATGLSDPPKSRTSAAAATALRPGGQFHRQRNLEPDRKPYSSSRFTIPALDPALGPALLHTPAKHVASDQR